jgi:hypothetical protein
LYRISPWNKSDDLQTLFNFTMQNIGRILIGNDLKASEVKPSSPFGNEIVWARINDFEAHGLILTNIRPADRQRRIDCYGMHLRAADEIEVRKD